MKQEKNFQYYREKYQFLFQVEELRECDETGAVQGRCKYHECPNSAQQNGWYTLLKGQLAMRAWSLRVEWDTYCFYCSDGCRHSCPQYGKTASSLIKEQGLIIGDKPKKELPYTQGEYDIWRMTVLTRASFLCEYCGRDAEDVHHSRPVKLEPFFSLDPDFGIACCEECHYKYGHPAGTECSTGALAVTICTEQ